MRIKKSPGSLDIGSSTFIEGSNPRHQANIQSGFDIGKAFTLDLTYRYVSGLGALTIPSYSAADVRFAWKLNQEFEASIVGQNLLQPRHYEFASDPGPSVGIKRSVYGQLTWRR
jgi:iron complex outermembrane receptor protein